ncbi:uncharacterized protein JCM10292_001713 [Rhodotorula paludigena]|uniref:uncharacterized protein n=1 Tax=Rhodotorula paludigena TaxID=86838 RepID=UPI0031817630
MRGRVGAHEPYSLFTSSYKPAPPRPVFPYEARRPGHVRIWEDSDTDDSDDDDDEKQKEESVAPLTDRFSPLPLELVFLICEHATIGSLLALSQTTKSLRRFLLTRSPKTEALWRSVRWKEGWPDAMVDAPSEAAWAHLLVGTSCQNCGSTEDVSRFEMLRVRYCRPCFRKSFLTAKVLYESGPRVHDETLDCCVETRVKPNSWCSITQYYFFLPQVIEQSRQLFRAEGAAHSRTRSRTPTRQAIVDYLRVRRAVVASLRSESPGSERTTTLSKNGSRLTRRTSSAHVSSRSSRRVALLDEDEWWYNTEWWLPYGGSRDAIAARLGQELASLYRASDGFEIQDFLRMYLNLEIDSMRVDLCGFFRTSLTECGYHEHDDASPVEWRPVKTFALAYLKHKRREAEHRVATRSWATNRKSRQQRRQTLEPLYNHVLGLLGPAHRDAAPLLDNFAHLPSIRPLWFPDDSLGASPFSQDHASLALVDLTSSIHDVKVQLFSRIARVLLVDGVALPDSVRRALAVEPSPFRADRPNSVLAPLHSRLSNVDLDNVLSRVTALFRCGFCSRKLAYPHIVEHLRDAHNASSAQTVAGCVVPDKAFRDAVRGILREIGLDEKASPDDVCRLGKTYDVELCEASGVRLYEDKSWDWIVSGKSEQEVNLMSHKLSASTDRPVVEITEHERPPWEDSETDSETGDDDEVDEVASSTVDRFSTLPLELVLLICEHSTPGTLLALSQTTKSLRCLLLTRSPKTDALWSLVRKKEGWPELTAGAMDELKYAHFLEGHTCQICDSEVDVSRSEVLRVRACSDCFRQNIFTQQELEASGPSRTHPVTLFYPTPIPLAEFNSNNTFGCFLPDLLTESAALLLVEVDALMRHEPVDLALQQHVLQRAHTITAQNNDARAIVKHQDVVDERNEAEHRRNLLTKLKDRLVSRGFTESEMADLLEDEWWEDWDWWLCSGGSRSAVLARLREKSDWDEQEWRKFCEDDSDDAGGEESDDDDEDAREVWEFYSHVELQIMATKLCDFFSASTGCWDHYHDDFERVTWRDVKKNVLAYLKYRRRRKARIAAFEAWDQQLEYRRLRKASLEPLYRHIVGFLSPAQRAASPSLDAFAQLPSVKALWCPEDSLGASPYSQAHASQAFADVLSCIHDAKVQLSSRIGRVLAEDGAVLPASVSLAIAVEPRPFVADRPGSPLAPLRALLSDADIDAVLSRVTALFRCGACSDHLAYPDVLKHMRGKHGTTFGAVGLSCVPNKVFRNAVREMLRAEGLDENKSCQELGLSAKTYTFTVRKGDEVEEYGGKSWCWVLSGEGAHKIAATALKTSAPSDERILRLAME